MYISLQYKHSRINIIQVYAPEDVLPLAPPPCDAVASPAPVLFAAELPLWMPPESSCHQARLYGPAEERTYSRVRFYWPQLAAKN